MEATTALTRPDKGGAGNFSHRALEALDEGVDSVSPEVGSG
jgi:hypothetical protein